MYDLKRKLIFTHPAKCAGTSIERAFGWHHSKNPDFESWKHKSLTDHILQVESLGYLAADFLKVSCTRNPWDRMVSWYYHLRSSAVIRFKRVNPNKPLPLFQKAVDFGFEDFVSLCYAGEKKALASNIWSGWETKSFFFHQGLMKIDLVVKCESFEEDLTALFKKLDEPLPQLEVFRQETTRPWGDDYRTYYKKPETVDMVAELGADAIRLFGYQFEG